VRDVEALLLVVVVHENEKWVEYYSVGMNKVRVTLMKNLNSGMNLRLKGSVDC